MKPRKAQSEALRAITKVRRQGRKRALVVKASGLGKTVLAAFDVRRYLRQHGGRVLYLCHQNDILEQAQKEFAKVLGWKKATRYAFFHGYDKRRAHEADIVFASFQTMREWHTKFRKREFAYIVVDESHHGTAPTYRPTLAYFQPKFLLAITATPDRMDLKDIREIYGVEVYNLPLEDALARGFLTRVDYRLVTDELAHVKHIQTPIGKMSVKQLNRTLFIPKRDEEIVEIIQKYVGRRRRPKVMIFCQTVEHCDRFAQLLPESLSIHYQVNPMEQRLRLQTFRKGGAKYVLTVDRFNEGIDIPEANVIVFLRSTASETIFLQQLGRGLRKVAGKKKVVVLDFVANCERLEMIHKIWQKVEEGHRHLGDLSHKPALEVEVGRLEFTEAAQDVLRLLQQIRQGYTKEMLILQLQRLAQRLGRTPEQKDVLRASIQGLCASPETFRQRFITFNAALEAAGLEIRRRRGKKKSREQLIADLQMLALKLEKSPSKTDVATASKRGICASINSFRVEFGNHNLALEAADLPVVMRRSKMPKLEGDLANLNQPNRKKPARGMTREALLKELKRFKRKLGHAPTWKDTLSGYKNGETFHPSNYRKIGGWKKAKELLGLISEPKKGNGRSMRQLIEDLFKLATRLGRTPTGDDLDLAGKSRETAVARTYINRFGSLYTAQDLALLPRTKRGPKPRKA